MSSTDLDVNVFEIVYVFTSKGRMKYGGHYSGLDCAAFIVPASCVFSGTVTGAHLLFLFLLFFFLRSS